MKEKKLKIAIYCLMATALIETLSFAYSFYQITELRSEYVRMKLETPLPSPFGLSAVITVLHIVFTFFVIQDLRRGKGWAWVGALLIFVITAPSWALPVCVFGLIALLDERVRADFIKDLDIHI